MAKNRNTATAARKRNLNDGMTPLKGLGYPNKANLKFDPEFPIEDIVARDTTPRVYDPKSNDVLRKSIEYFGFIDPIILDQDNRIVHGQHRFDVAKDMGFDSIPVVKTDSVGDSDHTTEYYPLIANKINDWSKWNPPSVDATLRKMDGGIRTKKIPGDNGTSIEVPDESGKYRELAKEIGLFIDVIPKNLTVSTATLLELARLREKSLGSKYQYDDAQLLYVETLRNEIEKCRQRLIDSGDTSGGIREKQIQFNKLEENERETGETVARVAFLSSMGVMNREIATRLNIPISSKTDDLQDEITVSSCLARAENRDHLDPSGLYAYLLQDYFENFDKANSNEKLKELDKKYKAGDLDREDFIEEVCETTGATKAQAEDWVDYHSTKKYLYQANEVFSYLIKEDNDRKKAEKRKIETKRGGKTPIDVKIIKSSSGKLCSIGDFIEMAELDGYYDTRDHKATYDEIVDKANKFYNLSSVREFNKVVLEIRDHWRQGPMQDSLFDLIEQSEDEKRIREANESREA